MFLRFWTKSINGAHPGIQGGKATQTLSYHDIIILQVDSDYIKHNIVRPNVVLSRLSDYGYTCMIILLLL